MGIKERKKRNKENQRQSILDAAEELFIRKGFENVSMRKIASIIEYSPTIIYFHFKNKNEIFYFLLDQYYIKLYKLMSKIQHDNADNSLICLQKGMRTYIDFGLTNPNYYKLAFVLTPEINAKEYMDEKYVSSKIFLSLRENIKRCIQEKIFRQMDPDLASQIIWSMNHGITSLLLTNPNFPWVDKDKLIDEYIKSAIKGLMA